MKQFRSLSLSFFKSYVRDKSALFWTILFPVLLTSIFIFAFRNFRTPDQEPLRLGFHRESLEISILENLQGDFLKTVQVPAWRSEAEALQRMEDYALDALLGREDGDGLLDRIDSAATDGALIITRSNLRTGILREVLSSILQVKKFGSAATELDLHRDFIEAARWKLDPFSLPFYAVLAMVSLYTYYAAIQVCVLLQANLSQFAGRLSLVPYPKWKLLLAFSLTGIFINLLSNAVLLFYLEILQHQKLIADWSGTVVLMVHGNLLGYALGLFVGSSNRLSEDIKIMIGTVTFVVLSGLAGMMHSGIVLVVRRYAPLLDRYNPVAVIAREFIRINGMREPGIAWSTQLYLLTVTLLLFASSILFLRDRKYDALGG